MEIKKGDSVLHTPTNTVFVVCKKIQNRKTKVLMLCNEKDESYLASECTPFVQPALLDQHALLSLLAAVEAMIASGCYELDLLEVLSPEQKRQVWGALSVGQRADLVSAKEGRKVA